MLGIEKNGDALPNLVVDVKSGIGRLSLKGCVIAFSFKIGRAGGGGVVGSGVACGLRDLGSGSSHNRRRIRIRKEVVQRADRAGGSQAVCLACVVATNIVEG